MITYDDRSGERGSTRGTLIIVRLDGKRAGVIRNLKGQYLYYYKPDGGKSGQVMNSIAAVKRSLEGDDA